jgi:hypothetical protein
MTHGLPGASHRGSGQSGDLAALAGAIVSTGSRGFSRADGQLRRRASRRPPFATGCGDRVKHPLMHRLHRAIPTSAIRRFFRLARSRDSDLHTSLHISQACSALPMPVRRFWPIPKVATLKWNGGPTDMPTVRTRAPAMRNGHVIDAISNARRALAFRRARIGKIRIAPRGPEAYQGQINTPPRAVLSP